MKRRVLKATYNPCHNCKESHDGSSLWLMKTTCVGCSFYPMGKADDGAVDEFQQSLLVSRLETIKNFKSNWKAMA